MQPKLVAILVILVLAPLSVITWLGLRTARDERRMVRHRFQALVASRLEDVEGTIFRVIDARARHLGSVIDRVVSEPFDAAQHAAGQPDPAGVDASHIRSLVRGERLARQIFVLDPGAKLVHPPLNAPRNRNEEAFLERTGRIWDRGESFYHPQDRQPAAASDGDRTDRAARDSASADPQEGWYTWYHGEGVNFIFWRRVARGRVIGIELDRLALLADIIGEMPATDPGDKNQADGRIQLVDANGKPVYAWGSYDPPDQEAPFVTRELGPPFGAWRLHYFASPRALGQDLGKSAFFSALTSLAALAAAMIGLAVYFIRESGREAREARQRVTFVNQVSHELKTPLTNIRMYAELLEDQIDDEDQTARNHLNVIVAESQRLSRLIGNVLSFARQQRRKLTIHRSAGEIDRVIRAVVDQFRPGLESAGLDIELDLQTEELSRFDPDALGQILGNLLSNVEKYAFAGRWVRIASRRDGDTVRVIVADRGPGIEAGSRRKIFQPFFRLSAKVTEGVAGAGIGLGIARELARLHGGDLVLEPDENGAVFTFSLDAPLQPREQVKESK